MANQAQFVLQVSDFTLAGIDKTNRILRVRGNAIPIIVPGSVSTATVVAGGSGWVVGDLFTLAKARGAARGLTPKAYPLRDASSGTLV